ncbi:proline/serine-rich coiled-coil protein 1 [Pleurodeles waltl]|uniref:proline/serine-rich coiled-coil protein 1 n=1 Tax=Pleurodeles waltl TaxID=8319 RepID=UPI0037094364
MMDNDITFITDETFDFGVSSFSDSPEDCAEEGNGLVIPGPNHFTERCIAKRIDLNIQGGDKSCKSRETLLRWSPLSTEKLEEIVKEANRLAAQLEKCAVQEKENSHLLINGSSLSDQPTQEGNPLVKVRLLQEERPSPRVPRSPRRETFFVMNSPLKDLLPTIDLETVSPLASPLSILPLESPLPPSIGESPLHTSLISRTAGCPQPSGKIMQKKPTPKRTPTSSPMKKAPCNPKLSSLASEKAQAQNERNSLIHPILQPEPSLVPQKITAQKNQLFPMNSSFILESFQAQDKVGVHKDKHSPIHCNPTTKSSATREKVESRTKTHLLIHSSPTLETSPTKRIKAEARSTSTSPVLSHNNLEFSTVHEKVDTKKTRRSIVYSSAKIESSCVREKNNVHKNNRSPICVSQNLECLFTMQDAETPKTKHSNHKLKSSPAPAKIESLRMQQSLILFSPKKELSPEHKKVEARKSKQLSISLSPKLESLSVQETIITDQSCQPHSHLIPKVESSPVQKNTEAVSTRHSPIHPSPSVAFSLVKEEVNAHVTKSEPIHDNTKYESLQSEEVDTLKNTVSPIHASPKLGSVAEKEVAEAQNSMHFPIDISLNLEFSQLKEAADARKIRPSPMYTSTTLKYSSQVFETGMNKHPDICQSPQLDSLLPHMVEAHRNRYSPVSVSNNLKFGLVQENADNQSNIAYSNMNTTLGSLASHENETPRNSATCLSTEILSHNNMVSPIHRSPKGNSGSSQEFESQNHMDFQIQASPALRSVSEQGMHDDQKNRDSPLHTIHNCELSLEWLKSEDKNSHPPMHFHPTLVSSPSQEIHTNSHSPLHQGVQLGPWPSPGMDACKHGFKLGSSSKWQTTGVQNNIDSPIDPILNVLPSPAEEATEAHKSRYSARSSSPTVGSSPSQETYMNWHCPPLQSVNLGSSVELNIADIHVVSSCPVNGVLNDLSSQRMENVEGFKIEHSLIETSPRVGYSPSHQVHLSRHSPEPESSEEEYLLSHEKQPHTCRDSAIHNFMHVTSSLEQKVEAKTNKQSPSNMCPNTRSLAPQETDTPKNRQSPIHGIPSLDCSLSPEVGTPKKHSPTHMNPKQEFLPTLEKVDVKKAKCFPIQSSPKLRPSPKPEQAKSYDGHFPTHTSPKLKCSPELVKIIAQNNRHSHSQQRLHLESSRVCKNQEIQKKRHSPIHNSPIMGISARKNAKAENIRKSPIHASSTIDSSLSTQKAEVSDNRHSPIYPSPKQKASPVQEKLIAQKSTRSPIQQRLTFDSSTTKEKSQTPNNKHLPMYFKPKQNSTIIQEKVVAKKNAPSLVHQRLKLESSTAQEKVNAEKNRQHPKSGSSQAQKVTHAPIYTSPKLKPASAHDKTDTPKIRHSPVHVHPKLVTVPTQEKIETQKAGHHLPQSSAKVESTFVWKKTEPRKKTTAEIGLMRPKAFSSAVSISTTEKQVRNTGIPLPTSKLPVSSIPKSIGLKARSTTPGMEAPQPTLDKTAGTRIGLPRPTSAPASKRPHGSSLIPSRIPTATTTSRLQPPKKVIIPGTQR